MAQGIDLEGLPELPGSGEPDDSTLFFCKLNGKPYRVPYRRLRLGTAPSGTITPGGTIGSPGILVHRTTVY